MEQEQINKLIECGVTKVRAAVKEAIIESGFDLASVPRGAMDRFVGEVTYKLDQAAIYTLFEMMDRWAEAQSEARVTTHNGG